MLLNCSTDGVSLWPTYRKPFDLIFQRAKNEEWSGRVDLNHRPPAPEAGALARLRYAPTPARQANSKGSLTAGIFRVAHPRPAANNAPLFGREKGSHFTSSAFRSALLCRRIFLAGSLAPKTKPPEGLLPPAAVVLWFRVRLEFVAQSELHHARVGQ